MEKRADYRAGLITAQIANMLRSEDSEAMHPLDYFPQHQRKSETLEFRAERRRVAMQQLNAMKLKARQDYEIKKGLR